MLLYILKAKNVSWPPLQGKYRDTIPHCNLGPSALDRALGYSTVFFWRDPARACHHAPPDFWWS